MRDVSPERNVIIPNFNESTINRNTTNIHNKMNFNTNINQSNINEVKPETIKSLPKFKKVSYA